MKRERVRNIIYFYKALKYLLAGIGYFLMLMLVGFASNSVIPLSFYVVASVFMSLGGHLPLIYAVFKKDILVYSYNDRKCIKYLILPNIIVSLTAFIMYWERINNAAWLTVLTAFKG